MSIEELEKLTLRLTELRTRELDEHRFFWNNALGLFVVSTPTHFIRTNPRWVDVTGFSEEELTSCEFWDFLHPDDVTRTKSRVDNGVRLIPSSSFINRWRKKDGGYAQIEWLSKGFVRGYNCAVGRYLGDEP